MWLKKLFRRKKTTDWYELTEKYHELTFDRDDDLESLEEEWQRELAAVWRLEADVNNGGYLQFISNWGLDTHTYAVAALHRAGAKKMAAIVEECFRVLSAEIDLKNHDPNVSLMPNRIYQRPGQPALPPASPPSQSIIERLQDLSYRFMDYPDDLPTLGHRAYVRFSA